MAEPTLPLPEPDVLATDERATLAGFLAYYRAVLARKADGISEQQARAATCPPSDLTILGLIRHMADVERHWSQHSFAGHDSQPIYYGDAHPDGDPDGDFHPPADATLDDALATYWDSIARADAIYTGTIDPGTIDPGTIDPGTIDPGTGDADAHGGGLDRIEAGPPKRHSLRWIYVHLIEEYARHCGHADLIRQAIDGVVDD